jgi:hypothetical protein
MDEAWADACSAPGSIQRQLLQALVVSQANEAI